MNTNIFAQTVQDFCTDRPEDLEIEIDQDDELKVYRVWHHMNRIGHIHPTKSNKFFVADPFFGFDGKKSFKNSDDAISYIVDCYLLWSEVQYGSNQS